ncbi:conjugal transfer protein MobB [Chryseobacterium wangxinyae]|uniref:conjugal transfer protein MobB n=1 Tax=Chryseobacterium sp. CY350 TaxID=2997336 RepID=UPI00226D8B13|nr:conjugal transfer protein MobB [Chryseobacterium sp. CY350]MCY0976853.1 relaxase/mobilization nuclease domain-containing protein [Chryseobacterium sp. CY350]WBZ96853.1 conjugal transfer protein MobB [Chryseobacterium sp. CY350]
MIAKIGRSSNLYGALAYNYTKVEKGNGTILHTNKIIESADGLYTVSKLAQSFETYLSVNRNTEKHTLHISLNPNPKDSVTDEILIQMAEEYMQKMGYGKQPFILFKHTDIERSHIHIVSVAVDENGRKISDRFEKKRSMEICRDLEKKYGLLPATENAQNKVEMIFKPVDYEAGDCKNQIASIIRHLPKYYRFRTLGEYNALLSLFNLTTEKVEGEWEGKLQKGLLYCILDKDGHKVGHPYKASLFGKNSGLPALEKHLLKCRENMNDENLKSHLKEVIANTLELIGTENDFKNSLIRQGINTVIRKNNSGMMYGITFIDHTSKTVWNGSSLGKEFSSNALRDRWMYQNVQEKKSLMKKENKSAERKNSLAPSLEKPHLLFDFLDNQQKSIQSEDGIFESIGGLLSFQSEANHKEQEFAYRMRKKRKRGR